MIIVRRNNFLYFLYFYRERDRVTLDFGENSCRTMVKIPEGILRSRANLEPWEQHKGVINSIFKSKLKSLIEKACSGACKSVAHNLR